MLIISVNEKIDNENSGWNRKTKQQQQQQRKLNKPRQKGATGKRSYSERVRAKWFCCAFKLGFPRLICKASLVFFLLSFFICSSILVLKWWQVSPI